MTVGLPDHHYDIRKAVEYLLLATKERSYYREACDTAKQTVRQTFQLAGKFTPPLPSSRLRPCSLPSVVHYSFDMAQQVHYPSDPLHHGPTYFLTPRKCIIFGVCCEASDIGRPTPSSACSTTSLRSMDCERRMSTYMQTIAWGKIKTTPCSITSFGRWWLGSTYTSLDHTWTPSLQQLPQTVPLSGLP